MYYELYVDSLFLVNFVMNLYLLILVNRSTLRTATRGRMVLGACVGALVYLLPFLIGGPAWLKWLLALFVGTGLMVEIAFHPRTVRAFLKMLRQLFGYSFLMGGLLLFVGSAMPFLQHFVGGIFGVLGLGAIGFLVVGYVQDTDRRNRRTAGCRAVLICGQTRVRTMALLDSGNSLREPISGKPVSIIDDTLYRELWRGRSMPYRAVPYHSIGRARGILKGYLLPELVLEIEGVTKHIQNVYVAVSEEKLKVGMILNPEVLEEGERENAVVGLADRKYEKTEMGN